MATTIETTVCGVTVAYDSEVGIAYLLTDCCNASGKGGEHGVICRACYQPVDAVYGDCARFTFPSLTNDWGRLIGWLNERGCPCATECAEHTVHLLTEAVTA